MKHAMSAIFAAGATSAWAHQGHGMASGSHWHATDAWGLALVLAAATAVWWWGRRP